MEVLVAVIIVGFTITIFFQLISSSMKLEIKSRALLETTLKAGDFFQTLMTLDIRKDDFLWEGKEKGCPWELFLYPIEVEKEIQDGEIQIKLPNELYLYRLVFYYTEERKKYMEFQQYKTHDKGYLSDDFKIDHLSELLEPESPDNESGDTEEDHVF
jgi:hypothetical protein